MKITDNSRKPSEIIQDFIDLMMESHTEYETADSLIKAENERTFVQTHLLEDCDVHDLFRFSLDWQKSLKERRIQKDRKALYECIHRFAMSEQNKPTLKRLKELLANQQKTESYLETPYSEREFKNNRR